MKISILGIGYVGLVTGVALSEVGHTVTCIDCDLEKINQLNRGISTIYEPGVPELLIKNMNQGRLYFTCDIREGLADNEIVYIAVGTPENNDGSANLQYVEQAARDIGANISRDTIIVTKSTVPIGTNARIKALINEHLVNRCTIEVVSNPEFLREGSALYDAFHADRIIIGAESEAAAEIVENINKPFKTTIFKTDLLSSELIKYASNAFLATKISYINEISNICELIGANVEDVSVGMGLDQRINSQFLKAGIGYGGSCFPKDIKALVHMTNSLNYQFELLESVMNVNCSRQQILLNKVKRRIGNLNKKKIALLGLAFKPNTDDMREAPSIMIAEILVAEGAVVTAYDPVAKENAEGVISRLVNYSDSVIEALTGADAALILTEWDEFKSLDLRILNEHMNEGILFDGRNCFSLEQADAANIEYHSIGRKSVIQDPVLS
ncbi:UDP-glucose 6-dehydrogenase [Paenibacillus helianthi]|uniref:UDP-glucose 6-dehydrogenase n=1 Tax=Paenibacillus helianthi TaxID=1349432 RepID=A0ABX3ET09_9BACL|nr:UDP-glucose/GDP-mannose dehydrogenase family protein [Paenibacillus helianthi]OKP91076.1 UDP-glucose 6-dehydrogenase [Paenibacillus helianthi]